TGTILEGNILEPAYESFVGIYPVLSRHGMTLGELARMYNAEQRIGADLTVVPVEGWRRDMWWDETGLPWVNPSPNIRRLEAAIHYPGTVFFEATNVSEGRGTDLPFEQIGAPWLRNTEVVAAMNAMNLPGIRFEAVEFPTAETARKYPGQVLKGVRLTLTDRASYRPLATSLLMIDVIRRLDRLGPGDSSVVPGSARSFSWHVLPGDGRGLALVWGDFGLNEAPGLHVTATVRLLGDSALSEWRIVVDSPGALAIEQV